MTGPRDLLQPCSQLAAIAQLRRTAMQRDQVTLGGLEQHLRAVIEREPHELGHHTPQGTHQGRRHTVTHILPHPRLIHDPTPVTDAAT